MKMRILHFSSNLFLPFNKYGNGGTEVFIQNLINVQKNMNEVERILWAIHDDSNLVNIK